MKILLLGSTGRTGNLVLKTALEQGFNVNVIVRDSGKLKASSPNLTVYQGLPSDKELLRKAIHGCEAVISTLNISRTSDFPWAPLRTPGNFLSETLMNILEVTKEAGVDRLILTTAWGVNESRKEIPGWFGWLIDNSNIGPAYKDHEIQEKILRNSSLNWTAVRPAGLINWSTKKPVRVSFGGQPKPRLIVSRQGVADFIIQALKDGSYIRQTPVVSF